MPRFSIVLVHCQGATPHGEMLRGWASIQAQTYRDFELLCYHDGPLTDLSETMPAAFTCTAVRHNDWGHTLRDLGIRAASGDYVMTFNSDNVLYPNALEEISKAIDRPNQIFDPQGRAADSNTMVVFPILMWGMVRFYYNWASVSEPGTFRILTGDPPIQRNVDAMQVAMKREAWLAEGGWSDRTYLGDGRLYEKFARKYGYRSVQAVLGEHY